MESRKREYERREKELKDIQNKIKDLERKEEKERGVLIHSEQNVLEKSLIENKQKETSLEGVNRKRYIREEVEEFDNLMRQNIRGIERLKEKPKQKVTLPVEEQKVTLPIEEQKVIIPILAPLQAPPQAPPVEHYIQYSVGYSQTPTQTNATTRTLEIRDAIEKLTKESQTQPLGITNINEIKELIKKYPDMKDVIVNSLIGELMKNKNVKREDIENVKRLYGYDKPFTLRAFDYATPSSSIIPKMRIFKKPQNLLEYENIIPPYSVIRNF
jgi:hypothetical protein